MAHLPLPKYLQEDNLTQQCKELLPNLPSENGWVGSGLYLYHGFWFAPAHLNRLLSCRYNFRARNDDVILATMPKSGTTWLKAILFMLSRHTMGEDSSGQSSPLLMTNPHELVPFLEIKLFVNNQSTNLSFFTSPRIFATQIPYPLLPHSIRDSKCKVVYLCRNVKDNFASLWHFTKKLRPKERLENALKEAYNKFCRGANLFGPYCDHVLGYWKASLEMPEKVLFLKYEVMKERPVESIKILAGFIVCPVEDDAANEIMRMCSFESLSKLEVNKNGKLQSGEENKAYFKKGEVWAWMNLLSPKIVDPLDRITQAKLSGSGTQALNPHTEGGTAFLGMVRPS